MYIRAGNSLKSNERLWAIRYVLFRLKKEFKKLTNCSFALISSFLVIDVSESLIFLKWNERCERIAHFAHQKWATMSDLLRSLRGNERCERNAHFAHQKWENEWIAHFFERINHSLIFFTKNERFARKSNERIPNPDICTLLYSIKLSLFPTSLHICSSGSSHKLCDLYCQHISVKKLLFY